MEDAFGQARCRRTMHDGECISSLEAADTDASGLVGDSVSTVVNAPYTSKWMLIWLTWCFQRPLGTSEATDEHQRYGRQTKGRGQQIATPRGTEQPAYDKMQQIEKVYGSSHTVMNAWYCDVNNKGGRCRK